MTKGCKIWLWIIFIGRCISVLIGFSVISISIEEALFIIVEAIVESIGIGILLFKEKKKGFYIFIGGVVLGLFYNIVNGDNILMTLVLAGLSPLITYYFIHKSGMIGSDVQMKTTAMYCGNCGKIIGKNSKFCSYCGEKNIVLESMPNIKQFNSSIEYGKENKIYSIISLILVVILTIRFINVGVSSYERNMDLFYWLNDSVKTIGIILHWVFVLLIVLNSLEYIYKFIIKKLDFKDYMSTGYGMLINCMLWGLAWVCSHGDRYEDMTLMCRRISATYEKLIGITIVFAVVIMGCGILMQRRKI